MNTSIRQFINEAPNLPMEEIQRRSQSPIITPDDTSFSDLDAIPEVDLFLDGGNLRREPSIGNLRRAGSTDTWAPGRLRQSRTSCPAA